LMFSFPVTVVKGYVNIVQDLELNDFSKEKLLATEAELKQEREAIKHLF